MATLRIDLGYDGSAFRGYATQPGLPTVQGTLEAALARLVGEVATVVAGRTDAGVHARHQVVSAVVEGAPEPGRVEVALRRLLAPTIAVWRVMPAPDGFDARFDAVSRTYRYRLDVADVADPLRARSAWHVEPPLDKVAMAEAAAHLVGQHDFAAFCRRAEGRGTVRRVIRAGWEGTDRDLVFAVVGTAFCHQQVRSMVGHLVAVGRGRIPPERTPEVLATRDRSTAGPVAPPHGLVLWEVTYPPGFAEPPGLP